MADDLVATPQGSPLDTITPRNRKFVKEYLLCGNATKAWMKSHRTKNEATAACNASKFLKANPELKRWLYEKQGLSDGDIIETIKEARKAEKPYFDRQGTPHVYPDHWTRLKAVEIAHKFKGDDIPAVVGGGMNVVIVADRDKGVFKVVEGEEA